MHSSCHLISLPSQKELGRPYVASTATLGRFLLLQNLLRQLAQDSDLEPPTLPPGLSDDTVDYLLRLIVHPYTTSPDHPALIKSSKSKSKSKGSFEVYMRCRDSTVEDELLNLKKFISVYEGERRPRATGSQTFDQSVPCSQAIKLLSKARSTTLNGSSGMPNLMARTLRIYEPIPVISGRLFAPMLRDVWLKISTHLPCRQLPPRSSKLT